MKKNLVALAVLCAMSSGAAFAQQADGSWLVRARAVNLDSANKGSLGHGSALDLSINDKVIPEVDITYFFSPNIAAELVLTYPQKQDVRSAGAKIGTLKHLPPTLTAQYHFTNFSGFKPYVGAGVNYTRFSGVDILGGAATIDRNSFGGALQAGVDFPITKNLYLNVDVKKVYIKTDVSVAGVKAGSFKVDPVLFGIGLGYRF
ncbi:MAG: OmpW family protein [Comamonadaceae bacterium]|nr:MAG: OmpW family protein [Comamonadaceae bacterium]